MGHAKKTAWNHWFHVLKGYSLLYSVTNHENQQKRTWLLSWLSWLILLFPFEDTATSNSTPSVFPESNGIPEIWWVDETVKWRDRWFLKWLICRPLLLVHVIWSCVVYRFVVPMEAVTFLLDSGCSSSFHLGQFVGQWKSGQTILLPWHSLSCIGHCRSLIWILVLCLLNIVCVDWCTILVLYWYVLRSTY